MRIIISIQLLLLFTIVGRSQNFRYEHSGGRAAIVSKDKLDAAKFVTDLRPAYSPYWDKVIDKVSVDIIATVSGETVSAGNRSDTLSREQKRILISADMNTDILIKTKFKFKNDPVDNRSRASKMEELETAIVSGPDVPAEFPGGDKQLSNYLAINVTDLISEKQVLEELSRVAVAFTVNEDGTISEVRICRSSNVQFINDLVLNAIQNMPSWKPAEYTVGNRVKWKFVLSIGPQGC